MMKSIILLIALVAAVSCVGNYAFLSFHQSSACDDDARVILEGLLGNQVPLYSAPFGINFLLAPIYRPGPGPTYTQNCVAFNCVLFAPGLYARSVCNDVITIGNTTKDIVTYEWYGRTATVNCTVQPTQFLTVWYNASRPGGPICNGGNPTSIKYFCNATTDGVIINTYNSTVIPACNGGPLISSQNTPKGYCTNKVVAPQFSETMNMAKVYKFCIGPKVATVPPTGAASTLYTSAVVAIAAVAAIALM